MTRRRSEARATPLALLLAATLPAQAPDAPTPQPALRTEQLTTPDGSRFVLVREPGRGELHWSIASWVDGGDDPPGLSGLAMVTMQTSLNGTWTIGSSDPDAERRALLELDRAWQQQLAQPGDADAGARVVALDERANELGDVRTFRRLLAAAPALRPAIDQRGPVAVLTLTTIEPALPEICRLLLERREQQALRHLARTWTPAMLTRLQQHARPGVERRLHTEALALLMPQSPALAALEAPPTRGPTREQALACWQASQHPTRTVHVLLGDFDLERTRALLQRCFASTALPTPAPRQAPRLRPPDAERRSVVPGLPRRSLTLAFVLPPLEQPWPLQVATRWLAGDPSGALARALERSRPGIQLACRAPWPRAERGRGLLLLDVHDRSGKPGLLDEVLARCRELAAAARPEDDYRPANLSLQREWRRVAGDPREHCARLAEYALLWPDTPPVLDAPPEQPGAAVRAVLQATFRSRPAVVEGRP